MSQGKQLNVNLSFTADSSQAKAQIRDLQQALQDIAKLPGKATSLFDDKDIKEASKAALELQQHLQKAVNVNTGNFDLSRLSTSLKASGQTLDQYYNKLAKVGPEGQNAFLQVARSISTAEAPVTRVNARLSEMMTTLKNTARWQLSSSILHGFMGTIQSAYGYAQKLNESLNNIRIVTGQSVDQMADFAKTANDSAKALSTTTTAYTDAALIYYQQGLSDSEVKERTDVTVKMANVARESSEEVSNQMTAVWNNFNKEGDQSAEHFADVMTKLGAETASSTSEIAEGLEKFAGIADTVGLSFDYATSALATITATSRESADVVGTALKTIFARVQGLQLGETLEDGTDLNKYSEALATVGIQIKDTSGEMKNMDTILSEMGEKWKTLSQDQQMALAQTVAGTRQYSQLMTLMSNWDFMQENLARTQNAEGTLQEQADIYAESWEAAQKRVRAALESIYGKLIDDQLFIKMTDIFAKLIEMVDGFIDSLGGLKGVLASVGSIFLSYYANKMPEALNNLKQNFMVMTGQATQVMQQMQQKNAEALEKTLKNSNLSESYRAKAEGIAKVNEMQQKLVANSRNMSTLEQNEYKARIQNVQAMYEEVAAIGQYVDSLKNQLDLERKSLEQQAVQRAQDLVNQRDLAAQAVSQTGANYVKASQDYNAFEGSRDSAEFLELTDAVNRSREAFQQAKIELAGYDDELLKITGELDGINAAALQTSEGQRALRDAVQATENEFEEYTQAYHKIESLSSEGDGLSQKWEKEGTSIDKVKQEIKEYFSLVKQSNEENNLGLDASKIDAAVNEIDKLEGSVTDVINKFNELKSTNVDAELDNIEMQAQQTADKLEKLSGSGAKFKESADAYAIGSARMEESKRNVEKNADSSLQSTFHLSTAMTEFASTTMAAYTAVESFSNGLKTLGDYIEGDATGMEALGAIASMLMSSMMALNSATQLAETLSVTRVGTLIAEKAGYLGLAGAATTAGGAATAAGGAATAAAAPILPIVLAITAALAVLAGIVWGVAKAFQAWKESTPEGQLEKARQEAEMMSEAYDKISEKTRDVQASLDDIASARDSLSEMTAGTEEWAAAMADLNNKVLELIDKYPDLAQGLEITNGALSINEKTMENFVKATQQQQALTAFAKANAMDTSKEENTVSKKERYSKDILQNRQDNLANFLSFDDYNKIIEEVKTSGTDILKNSYKMQKSLGITAQAADTIAKDTVLQGQISAQINEEKSRQLASETQRTAAANNYLNTLGNKDYNELVAGTEADQGIANIISNAIARNTSENSEAFKQAYDNIKLTGDTLLEEYLRVVEGLDENDEQWTESLENLTEKYGDKATEFAKQGLASVQAMEQYTQQNLDQLISLLQDSNTSSNLQPFLTQDQLDYNSLGMGQKESIRDMETAADVEKMFGLDEEALRALGYKSAEDFIKACQEKLDQAELNTDNMKNQLEQEGEDLATTFAEISDKVQELDPLQKIYDKMASGKGMDWKALTADTKGGFKDIFSGYEKEYNNLMKAVTENPDSLEKQQKAWDDLVTAWIKGSKEFQKVNKDTAKAAKEALKDRGVTGADKLIDQIAEENEQVKKLAKQYSKLAKKTKEYANVIKRVAKEQGKVDSKEEVEALNQVGKALSKITGKDVDFNQAKDFLASSEDSAETLQRALEGDADALEDVKTAMVALNMLDINPDINFNTTEAVSELEGLESYVANADLDAEGWATLNNQPFIQAWVEAELAAGKSAAEIERILSSVPGLSCDIELEPVTITLGAASAAGAANAGFDFSQTVTINKPKVKMKLDQSQSAGASIGGGGGGAGYGGGSGGGGGGGGCFAAGTLVHTLQGLKNIEDIQVEDIVLSYNEKAMDNQYSQVLETMIHDVSEDIYTITIEEEQLVATGIHPFYIIRSTGVDWVEAANLCVGDLVMFEDGSLHEISNIEVEYQSITVYNFEVSNNHNYYVGKNGILVHNKGKGGGGGGGKGEKEKEPDFAEKKDKVNEKADRYHDLNEAIEKVTHSMEMLDKQQQHLSGKELINSLTKQNKLLKEQRKNYNSLNKELEKELKYDKEKNKKTGKYENVSIEGRLKKYGAKFNKNDELTNYKATFNNMKAEYEKVYKHYNSVRKKYNKMSASEQENYKKELENAEKRLEKAEKKYETARGYLDRYDEIMAEIRKNKEEQEELLYQMIENNFQKFEIKFEMKLDVREAKRTVNDFIHKINKDFRKAFLNSNDWKKEYQTISKDIDSYVNKNKGKDRGTIWLDLDKINEITKDINTGNYGRSDNKKYASITEAIDKLKEAEEKLMDDAEDLHDLYEQAWDTYLDEMDQALDQWDKLIDKFDTIQSKLDHNKNIIEMLYGGSDTSQGRTYLSDYYENAMNNSLAKQGSLNTSIKALKELQSQTIVGNEDWEKYEEQIQTYEENLQDEIDNYLDIVQGQLENSVAIKRSEMDNNVWGKDFSQVQQEWNDKKAQAEGYYDQVQKIYQLEQLESKWQAAIRSTSSLKTQKQLTELMERQQQSLSEKTKLSEKDVELAEKELEMYKAQITLEEAQANKNSMKLTRDESGNWSYQYVVDQEDITQKQTDYLAKVDEWRTTAIAATEEITDKIQNSYQEFSDRLAEIMTNASLTAEEQAQKYSDLYETYYGNDGIIASAVEEFNFFQQEANEATFLELSELYLTDQDNFNLMTEMEQSYVSQLKDYSLDTHNELRDVLIGGSGTLRGFYGDLIAGANEINKESCASWTELSDSIKNLMYENDDSVKNIVNLAYSEMVKANEDYDKAVKNSEEKSGISWSNVQGQMQKVQDEIKNTENKTNEYVDNTQEKLSEHRDMVEKIRDSWESVKKSIEDAANELEHFLAIKSGETKKASDSNGGSKNANKSSDSGKSAAIDSSNSTGISSSSSSSKSNNDKAKGVAAAIWNLPGAGGWGDDPGRSQKLKEKKIERHLVQDYFNHKNGKNESQLAGVKPLRYGSFRTGGYTGEWNDGSGKLAVLHSKELVLNSSDTKNILDAVGIIRDISVLGSSVSSVIANGLKYLMNNLDANNSINKNVDNKPKQIFNITAEFPNADSVAEIQEAILGLPTLASQYISANS